VTWQPSRCLWWEVSEQGSGGDRVLTWGSLSGMAESLAVGSGEEEATATATAVVEVVGRKKQAWQRLHAVSGFGRRRAGP